MNWKAGTISTIYKASSEEQHPTPLKDGLLIEFQGEERRRFVFQPYAPAAPGRSLSKSEADVLIQTHGVVDDLTRIKLPLPLSSEPDVNDHL